MRVTTVEALSEAEELSLLHEFVDLEHGLIREILRPGVGFEDPDLFTAIALPSRIWNTGLFPGHHVLSEGNAVGGSDAMATAGAIGESLERYCLAFYRRDDLVFGSYEELSRARELRLVDPDELALFAADQHTRWGTPFTRQSSVYWTEGLSLSDKRSIWVPAQLVYLPYAPGPDEDYFSWSSSSGTAFGASLAAAALSGVCETVERDAFAIYWLNQLELPRIDLHGHAALAEWYRGLFGSFDNELNLFDITTDLGLPCFFAVVAGRHGQDEPFMSVGAACHPDPVRAMKKAVIEAFHTRRYGMTLMQLERGRGQLSPGASLEHNRFHEHVLRYTQPVPSDVVAFCLEPSRERSVGEVLAQHGTPPASARARLAHCVKRLAAHGFQTVLVDATTPEVAEKGFFSVKALVPGLHPLWAGEDVPLGGTRIYEVPPRLGLPRRARAELNLFPHPFP